ncbi:hypothetical protein [Novosphingobium sp.]|uniref:hypothetical protein n=1 Tax=Novosphingobium sp. TaxID=1874826 RepID=UPI0025DA3681|nr:hypothetical protein [Novosphingobium sp.]
MRGLTMIGAFAVGTLFASASAFAGTSAPVIITPPNTGTSIGIANSNKCKDATPTNPIKGCSASH